ncbi:hypothetical protein A8L44_09430 [Bacillus sp. FJAT-27986]|nr:hypothetical protein A8L44_09430 [Bacillus sp. FJAT-27986]
MKKAGNYKITYTISDKAKNKTTIVRNIKVVDNVKPVITGVKDIQLHVGETINILEGISATDNNDGNLTSKIKIEGSVNFKKAGTYMLTYSVTDQSGNITSISRKITVIDNVNPVLLGVQDIAIPFGEKFDPLAGISASDNSDGDLSSSIRVNGSVNINKAGSYALTYSVSDQSGNTVSNNRIVTVVDNIKPVISGASDITIGLYTEFNLLDGINVSDINDGDLTSYITTDGSVDTQIEGQYPVTYKVSDAAGNIAVVTRIITVQKIPVSGVSIVAPDTMKTGKTQQLTAIVTPMDATIQQIIWQSSDESIATISEDGMIETILEGTVTITATVDGISTSKTITISDRPNVYPYISGKSTINGVIKSFSISIINQEFSESVYIEKVDIYENNRLFTSHSAESLQNSGIKTDISPRSNWGMSISFKLGIWANQSEVVITVRTENGKTYQYPLSL